MFFLFLEKNIFNLTTLGLILFYRITERIEISATMYHRWSLFLRGGKLSMGPGEKVIFQQ